MASSSSSSRPTWRPLILGLNSDLASWLSEFESITWKSVESVTSYWIRNLSTFEAAEGKAADLIPPARLFQLPPAWFDPWAWVCPAVWFLPRSGDDVFPTPITFPNDLLCSIVIEDSSNLESLSLKLSFGKYYLFLASISITYSAYMKPRSGTSSSPYFRLPIVDCWDPTFYDTKLNISVSSARVIL